MKVFEIKEQFRKLEEMMNEFDENGEFIYSAESLSHFVKELEEKKELKLNNIEDLKREYKLKIGGLEDKIKSLNSRKKQFEKIIDNLQFLQKVLLDGEKLKTDEYTFSFRKSQSVEIYDVNMLEDKYFKIEKKPILKDIAEAIKQANSKGESFFGAEIKDKKSLVVR